MNYVRSGVHPQLEEEANRLIKESLEGVTSQSEKSDILTPWKEQNRKSKEVYTSSGAPDASTRSGMFHRAINRTKPYLNSVDGVPGGARKPSRSPESDSGSYVYDPWIGS